MNINTFEQNFSTFDKLKTSPEEEEKYSVPQNLNDEKNKKGLSDLTNILKNHKPNIPLKNPKKSVGPESNNRINFEISDLHCDISNKIKKSNSSYLQKFSPEDDLKATSNDPVAQLQEVFQIIIHLAAERGKLKVTPNELSEEESENYEKLLRQLEAEVRNHVGIQQQLTLFDKKVQEKLQEYERNHDLKKVSPSNIEKIKKENNFKREELKRKQQEIDSLNKELSQKNDLIKTQADKLKHFNPHTFLEKAPFQNSYIEQQLDNRKMLQATRLVKNQNENNTENNNPEGLYEKDNRRKTSVSSVSGSNRSNQTQNSLKSNFEFVEKNQENNVKKDLTDSSFLKKNLDGLSEKERGIIKYFQSKLNQKDEQVNFLQNQIKSLMNTNRLKDSKATIDSPNYCEEDDYPQAHNNNDYRALKPSKLLNSNTNNNNNDSKRLDLKQKSSMSNLEKAYIVTDRIYPPRDSSGVENEKSFITTDRIYHGYHAKNASFHNDAGKDLNRSKLVNMNEENATKANKYLLQEKSQKDLKNQNTSSNNQLKTSFLNKSQNKTEIDDDLNSKYFLKASKNKSPLKQDYKNYECGDKKRDLSAINNKIYAETQRIMNEQTIVTNNGKNIDGKKNYYVEFLNKNRNYLFQD